jgi:hypothetical protein
MKHKAQTPVSELDLGHFILPEDNLVEVWEMKIYKKKPGEKNHTLQSVTYHPIKATK